MKKHLPIAAAISTLLATLIATGAQASDYRYASPGKPAYSQRAYPERSISYERRVVYERPVAYERVTYERQQAIYAPVLSARPIYRQVAVEVPVSQCHIETQAYRERGNDSATGTLVGGLIGAVVGYNMGHSSGHAAAAGGLVGAAIGNSASTRGATRYEEREVCRPSYRTEYENRLSGYEVSYRHQGRVFVTETSSHPGDHILLTDYHRP